MKKTKNIVPIAMMILFFVVALRFLLRKTMTVSELAIKYAETQEGITEIPKGSNRGKDVEKYLKSVGLDGGNPWCMAFVYWCFQQAAKELGVSNPLYRTGGVLSQLNARKIYASKTPKIGSVFIMDFGGGKGHTGIVTGFNDKYVSTLEGNTDGSGSRTGGQAMRHNRPYSQIKTFLNFE